MKKKILVILLLLCLSLFVGCKEKEIDWDSKIISDVTLVQETFDKSYEYDEFELSNLLLHVAYTDNMSRDIPVTEDMLSEKDLQKTKSAGNPKITIEYAGFEITAIVKLVNSALLDADLNKSGEYSAVIKAIRDKETNTISFIIESYDNIAGLQFAYTYDNSIMQLSNGLVNSSLKGTGKVEITDGKVSFAYAEPGTAITTETVLFTVSYTGDFRTSKLGVDETFTNRVYLVAEDYTTTLLDASKVLYHASIK